MDKLETLIQQWQTKESTSKCNLISFKENLLIKRVIDVLNDLKSTLSQLQKYGEEHDYSVQLKYNGFRSFVKINRIAIERFEETLIDQSKSKRLNESKLEKCLSFLMFVNKLNSIVLQTYKKNQTLVKEDVNQNRKEHTLLYDEKMTCEIYEQYFSMEEDLKIYYDGHLSFYLTKHLKTLVDSVSTIVLLLSCLPFSLFIHFSKERLLNTMSNALFGSTITWPGSVEICNKPFVYNLANLLTTFRNGVQSKNLFVPKQQKWLLKPLDECHLDEKMKLFDYKPNQSTNRPANSSNLKKNGVRIKLIHHSSKPKDGIVMLHVHGGAFIYHSPDCHEHYLQNFVEKIPNLYILSVDYKLREKYGSAHQDILDAYLWLSSNSPDVQEVLGFQPKRILLCGDSAGAFLSFTLCKILKDLQKFIIEQKLNETIHIPDTIINFYGFTTLNKHSPSMILTFIDTIITLPLLRAGFGSLVYGCENPNYARRIFFPLFTDRTEKWYSVTNPKRNEINEQLVEQIEKHPYLEPIDHVDFEEFKDVNLYLVTCEYDVFLDANIELARKWKGFVQLDVFDDACHGFLQFSLVDPVAKKAVSSSIQIIKEAIARPISKS